MADPSPYRKAQEAARARANALRLASLRNLDRALQGYIDNLLKQLKALPADPAMVSRHIAVDRAVDIAEKLKGRLLVQMEAAIKGGRDLAFSGVLELQREATLMVAQTNGVPNHLLGAVMTPKVTLAGAWESLGRGASTWKTLIKGYVQDAAKDAQFVVTQGLLEGISPDELSKRLRPYLQGSEPFHKAFQGLPITDKMLRDPRFTGAAKRLRYNADRIALSEIQNARSEAEIQAFAADPFVKAVRWTRSPNRGTLRQPDACDGLAQTDYFGLGKGVYPVTRVPTSPHPFCRCERVPVARPVSEMHQPKPDPPRKANVETEGTGCE